MKVFGSTFASRIISEGSMWRSFISGRFQKAKNKDENKRLIVAGANITDASGAVRKNGDDKDEAGFLQ